ncbi:MAG: zf-HC2 domain-containing protein [Oscillospiraceae bacterium]|nr:zf-HC2 domain-containing protein [Oscillospiraceae bacterium]
MKETCGVVQDLLPLVQDGVASEESCRLVREHLAECTDCQMLSAAPVKLPDEKLDRRLVAAVRKAFFRVGMGLLLIGGLTGVVLTDSMGVFYNFILMPVLGMLGYWLLGKKSLFVPLGIFLLGYLSQIPKMGFAAPFPYAFLYGLFCAIGLGMGFLFRYAFGKEEEQ